MGRLAPMASAGQVSETAFITTRDMITSFRATSVKNSGSPIYNQIIQTAEIQKERIHRYGSG